MADELPAKVREAIANGPAQVMSKYSYDTEDTRDFAERIARLAIEEATRSLRERLERAQADLALYVQVSSVLDGMTGRAPTSAEWEQIKELAKQVKGGIMLDLAIREAKESAHD